MLSGLRWVVASLLLLWYEDSIPDNLDLLTELSVDGLGAITPSTYFSSLPADGLLDL